MGFIIKIYYKFLNCMITSHDSMNEMKRNKMLNNNKANRTIDQLNNQYDLSVIYFIFHEKKI